MPSPFCHTPDCENYREGNSNFCASCNREARKAARLALMDPKKRKPIKKVSAKRGVENRAYTSLRKQYLAIHQTCETATCKAQATTIHHQIGREGDRLLDTNFWMAVCMSCHTTIELNPNWSKANGYSFDRLTIETT